MADVAETVVADVPEVEETKKVDETGPVKDIIGDSEPAIVVEEGKTETEAAEPNGTEAEKQDSEETAPEAAETEEKVEAKDTNGNDRKRVASADDEKSEDAEVAAENGEEDAPAVKKTKVDEEIDQNAAGDAPVTAVAAE